MSPSSSLARWVRAAIAPCVLVGWSACASQGATPMPDGGSFDGTPGADTSSPFRLGDAITATGDAGHAGHDARARDATARHDGGAHNAPDAARETSHGGGDAGGVDATRTLDSGPVSCAGGNGCPEGQICVADVCSPCVAATCVAAGISCGPLSEDCGNLLSCGTCTAPDTCGGGGTSGACGCTATTCAAVAATCGSPSNGCGGTLSCGSCAVPETCSAGACTVPCGVMVAGDELTGGQRLVSCDGRFALDMQGTDGNLVVYFGSDALWAAKTAGNPGDRAVMQGDGNFVVYSTANKALWNSKTEGNPGAWLIMQTDGNLVIYSPASVALWSSGTCCH